MTLKNFNPANLKCSILPVKWLFIILAISLISFQVARATEMAITVDDLPSHDDLHFGKSRLAVARKMLKVLKKHKVPEVYGFVNGISIPEEKDNIDVLKAWVDAGYPLGNHTFSHIDLNKVSAEQFIADTEKMIFS